MANADDFLYEYAVVRYVPQVDRQEFINIGLLMMCKRRRWLQGRILLQKERIRAFDRNVNFDFLGAQSSVFERNDVPDVELPVEEKYRWLAAVKSAILQVSPSHPGYLPVNEGNKEMSKAEAQEMLSAEFNRLFNELVKA